MKILDTSGNFLIRTKDLKGVNLHRAVLSELDLRSMNFNGSCLRKARLLNCNLRECFFIGTDLRGADLSGSGIKSSYFIDADLRGAKLVETDLRDANFKNAKLDGADFRGSNLTDANIDFKYFNFHGSVGCLNYYGHIKKILLEDKYFTVEMWLKNYKKVLKKYGYDNDQISEYARYIKFCQLAG